MRGVHWARRYSSRSGILPSFRELLDQVDLSDDEQLGPTLSVDETELVEILRGILSASKGVKDMNEAWLVEASLSPAPHGMFFLFVHHAVCFSDCTLSCRNVQPQEDEVRRSSQVWTEGPLSEEYLQGALHPVLVKQMYECSFEELMNKAGRSVGLHFVNLIGTAEFHVKELEDEAKKTWAELEWKELELEVGVLRSSLDGAQNDRARLEGEVLSLTEATTFLKVKLKSGGPKAVAAYKASRGFELGLEKMRRVSYEFEYQVALERL
ncbi:hypothetical protein BHM03_00037870 [Ensete ventricosum]|nr:hypothetical protein BHM03_00037870 [Ensete ventricosum]